MNFERFVKKTVEKVQEIVGADVNVQVKEYRKNNNVLLHGMAIHRRGQNVSPVIYLDSFFEMLEDGIELDHIVSMILEVYNREKPYGNTDMDFFTDYEKVKYQIVYRLVNQEKNEEMLADIPHIEFLDLAICFYYYGYNLPKIGEGVVLIRNSHLEMWHVDCQELKRQADCNTPRLMPVDMCTMDYMLKDLIEKEELEEMRQMSYKTGQYLYILSNKRHYQGAAAILYPGVLSEAANRLGGSFYIFPSSTHEVILLLDDREINGKYLYEMISEINRTMLKEDEVLSDYAYHYNADTGKVTEIR